MNDYLLQLASGTSTDIQAEPYEGDGDGRVFFDHGQEVARVKISDVTSITRSRV